VVVHTCNPITEKVEARGLHVCVGGRFGIPTFLKKIINKNKKQRKKA
jgi:hypothetical protein